MDNSRDVLYRSLMVDFFLNKYTKFKVFDIINKNYIEK